MKKQPQGKCKPTSLAAKIKKKDIEEDFGPTMYQFTCEKCKRKLFDTRRYFGEKATKICMWCTKFPHKETKK